MDAFIPIITALVGAVFGGGLTYLFALKKDREQRRREKIVSHLIEAYRNFEKVAQRSDYDPNLKDFLETSVASVFLFGSEEATKATSDFCNNLREGCGDVVPLLQILRKDLRRELGLQDFDVPASPGSARTSPMGRALHATPRQPPPFDLTSPPLPHVTLPEVRALPSLSPKDP